MSIIIIIITIIITIIIIIITIKYIIKIVIYIRGMTSEQCKGRRVKTKQKPENLKLELSYCDCIYDMAVKVLSQLKTTFCRRQRRLNEVKAVVR